MPTIRLERRLRFLQGIGVALQAEANQVFSFDAALEEGRLTSRRVFQYLPGSQGKFHGNWYIVGFLFLCWRVGFFTRER